MKYINFSMEHTPFGHSIPAGTSLSIDRSILNEAEAENFMTQAGAAKVMMSHFRQWREGYHGRILKSLLRTTAKLDDTALASFICAADKLFFQSQVARRIRWDWTDPHSLRYQLHRGPINTNHLRKTKNKDRSRTLIILSRPIFWCSNYNHQLLLSKLLHARIHYYLFMHCEYKALIIRDNDRYTDGFRDIAEIIARWSGGLLELDYAKADLTG